MQIDIRIYSFIIASCVALFFAPPLHAQSNQNSTVTGDWEGALSLPSGSLRIVFHITADEEGGLTTTMDSPDQGATGIPVASTAFEAGALILGVTAIAGKYEGKLSEDGQTLSGEWSQGGASFPLELSKTDKPAQVNRPQEPKRPFPYDEEQVFFDNEDDGVRLAGTLTTPPNGDPHPTVVLISGSGAQDRDEALMGHKPFLVLSDYLTRRGIAVLRYDDRGTAESTGNFSIATTRDLANDAQAAVDYLKTRADIDHDKIGLAGHSEGGIIAPMLAVTQDNVSFIVMLAGPGLPGDEILRMQGELMARAGGMSDELVEKMLHVNNVLYETAVKAPEGEIASRLKKTIGELRKEIDPNTATALGLTEDREQQIIQQLSSPWFRYFLTYDPQPTLQMVQTPVLSLIGEKDLQVPAKENTEAIKKAFKAANNKHTQAKILPGLNHLFQTATTGSVSEYAQIEETFSPEALALIGDWILEQTGR